MEASDVARIFGLENEYVLATKEIGKVHKCNQGCGEGWCSINEDHHQMELLKLMKPNTNR